MVNQTKEKSAGVASATWRRSQESIATSAPGAKEPEWYIGIDLGTTNTYIAAYDASERKVYTNESKFFLGKADGLDGLKDTLHNIPTRITVDLGEQEGAAGEFLVGTETQQYKHRYSRAFTDLKTVAREITPPNGWFGAEEKPLEYPFEHCEYESELEFGHRDAPRTKKVKDLFVAFLRRILCIGDSTMPRPINERTLKKIVIGCPANQQEKESYNKYKDKLQDILADCFLGTASEEERVKFKQEKTDVIEEPILAGATWLYSEGLRAGAQKNVLVIDIGGGTTDFAIVQYSGRDKPKSIANGSCELAGNAIDRLIEALLPDGFKIADAPPDGGDGQVYTRKDWCRQAKEALFEGEDGGGTLQGGGSDQILLIDSSKRGKQPSVTKYIDLWTGTLYQRPAPGRTPERVKCVEDGGIVVFPEKRRDYRFENIYSLEQIAEKIGEKLAAMIDTVKNGASIPKIDTVFFIGGTSGIGSLREVLIGKLEKILDLQNGELKVETVIPQQQQAGQKETQGSRALFVPNGKTVAITQYNAVAVGALAWAAEDTKYLFSKPEIWLYGGIIGTDIGKMTPESVAFAPSGPLVVLHTCVEPEKNWVGTGGDLKKSYRDRFNNPMWVVIGEKNESASCSMEELEIKALGYEFVKNWLTEGGLEWKKDLLFVIKWDTDKVQLEIYSVLHSVLRNSIADIYEIVSDPSGMMYQVQFTYKNGKWEMSKEKRILKEGKENIESM